MARLIILNDRQTGKTDNLLQMITDKTNQGEVSFVIGLNTNFIKEYLRKGLEKRNVDLRFINFLNLDPYSMGKILGINKVKINVFIDELFYFKEELVRCFFRQLKDIKENINIYITSTLNDEYYNEQKRTLEILKKDFEFDVIDFSKRKEKEERAWAM